METDALALIVALPSSLIAVGASCWCMFANFRKTSRIIMASIVMMLYEREAVSESDIRKRLLSDPRRFADRWIEEGLSRLMDIGVVRKSRPESGEHFYYFLTRAGREKVRHQLHTS